jgi:hypothetical protein
LIEAVVDARGYDPAFVGAGTMYPLSAVLPVAAGKIEAIRKAWH